MAILTAFTLLFLTVAVSFFRVPHAHDVSEHDDLQPIKSKNPEDSIPVIEIRGEGKPMTSAQIRALEEETEGKPLDIKVKHTWIPRKCPRKAARRDFVTFHYKAYYEDGKKFDQSYTRDGPIRLQLGMGMTLPGLDKGMKGMCDTELRNIKVPWRLAQRRSSKTWKTIPTDEHWLGFDIEMLKVERWTPELQFAFMDLNNDTQLTVTELGRFIEKLRKEFGKKLPNDAIDSVQLCKYFVKYFDVDGDEKVSNLEYTQRVKEDELKMKNIVKKPAGRKRDPGVSWVLDFNNDGVVTYDETEAAVDVLNGGDEALKEFLKRDKAKRDEL